MQSKALDVTLGHTGRGLLMGYAISLLSCAPPRSVPMASRNLPRPAPHRPDPLLGKWVMVNDNGTGAAGAVADFRPDGTVVFTRNGKKGTIRYKREPGQAWVGRRTAGLGMKSEAGVLDAFNNPGVEMIEFADEGGKFMDYGGNLLTLDPNRRVLYNFLTQLWCRPGDESRVKRDFN